VIIITLNLLNFYNGLDLIGNLEQSVLIFSDFSSKIPKKHWATNSTGPGQMECGMDMQAGLTVFLVAKAYHFTIQQIQAFFMLEPLLGRCIILQTVPLHVDWQNSGIWGQCWRMDTFQVLSLFDKIRQQ
jgi:hypothetical protein